jgi:hypothetical protein
MFRYSIAAFFRDGARKKRRADARSQFPDHRQGEPPRHKGTKNNPAGNPLYLCVLVVQSALVGSPAIATNMLVSTLG